MERPFSLEGEVRGGVSDSEGRQFKLFFGGTEVPEDVASLPERRDPPTSRGEGAGRERKGNLPVSVPPTVP